jgi:sugar lactone lactonase YvrE
MKLRAIAPLCLLLAAACGKKSEESKSEGPKDPKKDPSADQAKKDAPPAAPDAGTAGDAVIRLDQAGFSTPESVLYDEAADAYLVSNIEGTPLDKDGKGFLSKVSPDGQVELKWIESGKNGVTLNAPKGSAIAGDVLYVADIDVVRMFDRATGAPKGEIAIKGATFLNDVAAGDGTVWVTDTGMDKDFKPTGTDAVYAIATAPGNQVEKVITGKELGNPNGIALSTDGVRVVTFGTGETYQVVRGGEGGKEVERKNIEKLPKGQNDGVVELAGMPTLISSWEGKSILARADDGKVTELITGVESPADIGYDHKRKRVLIPLFTKNSVEIHPLK